MNYIRTSFRQYCETHGVSFQVDEACSRVKAYDRSTLFCPAGMQRFKAQFIDESFSGYTVANYQKCLRLDDLEQLGDGIHLGAFTMLGLFSFRAWTVRRAIDFWITYLDSMGLENFQVTVHPDMGEWAVYYYEFNEQRPEGKKIEVLFDPDCTWTDGKIGGYCTEFYIDGVEVGNIVNPLGTCIDCGFGADRLHQILEPEEKKLDTRLQALHDAAWAIIDSGYEPGNSKQGYVLRRLLRTMRKENYQFMHRFFNDEKVRYIDSIERYKRLKDRHLDKTSSWWWDTHGIDLNEVQETLSTLATLANSD